MAESERPHARDQEAPSRDEYPNPGFLNTGSREESPYLRRTLGARLENLPEGEDPFARTAPSVPAPADRVKDEGRSRLDEPREGANLSRTRSGSAAVPGDHALGGDPRSSSVERIRDAELGPNVAQEDDRHETGHRYTEGGGHVVSCATPLRPVVSILCRSREGDGFHRMARRRSARWRMSRRLVKLPKSRRGSS
jgi:hypothetical protein